LWFVLCYFDGYKIDGEIGNEDGNMLDAIIVAMDALCRRVGTKKFKKRIFVVTDGEKEMDGMDDGGSIIKQAQDEEIEINVVGIGDQLVSDFTKMVDEEEEEEEEDDSISKSTQLLFQLTTKSGGAFINGNDSTALQKLGLKFTNPRKTKGRLELGAVDIPIQMWSLTQMSKVSFLSYSLCE